MSVCQLWTLLTLYLLSAARPLSSATMQCNGCVVCVCVCALFLSVISALSLTSTLSLCSFLLCSLRCSVSLTLRLHLCLLPIHCSPSAPCPRCSSNTAVLWGGGGPSVHSLPFCFPFSPFASIPQHFPSLCFCLCFSCLFSCDFNPNVHRFLIVGSALQSAASLIPFITAPVQFPPFIFHRFVYQFGLNSLVFFCQRDIIPTLLCSRQAVDCLCLSEFSRGQFQTRAHPFCLFPCPLLPFFLVSFHLVFLPFPSLIHFPSSISVSVFSCLLNRTSPSSNSTLFCFRL